MTNLMDINLLPTAHSNGRDYPELIGLHCAEPPRKAARGRDKDRLILYLFLEGNAILPAEQRDQVLFDLSRLFFRTPGSATAALRAAAEELNSLLLERNIKLGTSRQCIGHLVQAVLRENRLTVAQSGSLQIHRISSDGVSRIDNPDLAGNGLGISKTGLVHYSQLMIEPKDVILFSARQAPEWVDENLQGVYGQGPETLRRRLYYQTKADINAVAIQVVQGKGNVLVIRSGDGQQAVREQKDQEIPTVNVQPPTPVVLKPQNAPQDSIGQSVPPIASEEKLPSSTVKAAFESEKNDDRDSSSDIPSAESARSPNQAPASLLRVQESLRAFLIKAVDLLKIFLGRMLPDESLLNISTGTMVAIALLVPIIVVIAATSVYFKLGRTAQFDLLTSQAEEIILRSENQTDQSEKRADLSAALSLLQKADTYASDDAAHANLETKLSEVRSSLDDLDLVKRLNYQPAIIGGLQLTDKITDIQAVEDQLFMLDQTGNRVLRAYLTDRGYEIDYTFNCSSGNYGEIGVGKLVEIIAWPAGYKPQASLLAVDETGNVLYCQPDQMPTAERLAPGEGEAWGKILEASLDQGDFYALDLSSNGVWIYWRANFNEQPTLFFDEQIPPLQNAADMLVDRDDLYLLQQDGRLIICARETLVVSPTRCQFQNFVDRRSGRENLPFNPSSPFTQITYSAPPDPSLYFLESASHAVYHFSLRNLAMQRQFLPEQLLPSKPATAFAVNQAQRTIFLAIGNQVYYAAIP